MTIASRFRSACDICLADCLPSVHQHYQGRPAPLTSGDRKLHRGPSSWHAKLPLLAFGVADESAGLHAADSGAPAASIRTPHALAPVLAGPPPEPTNLATNAAAETSKSDFGLAQIEGEEGGKEPWQEP